MGCALIKPALAEASAATGLVAHTQHALQVATAATSLAMRRGRDGAVGVCLAPPPFQ